MSEKKNEVVEVATTTANVENKKRGRKPGTTVEKTVKTENVSVRQMKKTATAKTNSHIKEHRKVLNEIFFCLEDVNVDEEAKTEFLDKLNSLTEEYTSKLLAMSNELTFIKSFSGYTDDQKEMLKKYLGL
jgi:flagellar hook-basal body complex protein FliE